MRKLGEGQGKTIESEPYKSHYHGPDCVQCGWPFDPGDSLLIVTNGAGEAYDGNPFCCKTCVESYYRSTAKHIVDSLMCSGAIRM